MKELWQTKRRKKYIHEKDEEENVGVEALACEDNEEKEGQRGT